MEKVNRRQRKHEKLPSIQLTGNQKFVHKVHSVAHRSMHTYLVEYGSTVPFSDSDNVMHVWPCLWPGVNPLYFDRFSHTDTYIKDEIGHYIFEGVTGRNFQTII